MANKEQLSVLKQGVEVWNGWRAKNIYIYADFNGVDLNGADLRGIDLRIAHLRRANLFRADLSGADLSGADLSDADFREANLSAANLTKANLNGANLSSAFVRGANLSLANLLAATLRNTNLSHANLAHANLMVANLDGADLSGANLSQTNLIKTRLSGISLHRADLSGARLSRANLAQANLLEAKFIHADLNGTNLSEAKVGSTVFANLDLSKMTGLESVDHRGPSHISIDAFIRSEGKIPEIFLRGCGLSDWEIEQGKLYKPDLSDEEIDQILDRTHGLRASHALQVSALFISYAHADGKFVDKVGDCLTSEGIRYWRDIHEPKAGRIATEVDRVIRQNPTVLVVLSRNSLSSDWVEHEVRMAQEAEKELGRSVLCPVALDDSWKESRWTQRGTGLLIEHNILDFSAWKNDGKFGNTFQELLEELKLSYKR